jgi:hypothetical protein
MRILEQHWLVRFDIQELYQWYERRQRGLGRRFNRELRMLLRRLPATPASCHPLRRHPAYEPAFVSLWRVLFRDGPARRGAGSPARRPRFGGATRTTETRLRLSFRAPPRLLHCLSALRIQILLSWGQDNTEAVAIGAGIHGVGTVGARCRPAVPRGVDPTATADHAVRACCGKLRINDASAW